MYRPNGLGCTHQNNFGRFASNLATMKSRGPIFLALMLVAALAAVPAAATRVITTGGLVMGGFYSSKWVSSADISAMGVASGKRASIAGSFHPITETAANTEWILEQAWIAQTTPFANVTIEATAAAIASGAYDGDIGRWADQVKLWLDKGGGRSLFVAPLQEMNGAWVPYGADPTSFKKAYKKFVDAFASRGIDGSKVRFVFAPASHSTPPFKMADYYPGPDVVDVLGLSAYNFGSTVEVWKSVAETMQNSANELRALAPDKPIFLAQVGTSNVGGDQDAWLNDFFSYVTVDSNIAAFIYFNFDKETDFRVWKDNQVVAGWKQGMEAGGTIHLWPLVDWFQPGPLQFSPFALVFDGTFADDDLSAFQADIEWLAASGITKGCNPPFNDHFCPTGFVTREQMASFLARALALPPPSTDRFVDDNGSPHENDINSVAEAGITLGCEVGYFCPGKVVSREQMASFLTRGLELSASETDQFTDDTGSPHEADINTIAGWGITVGCGGTKFCPDGLVTREQMAAFLHRALG